MTCSPSRLLARIALTTALLFAVVAVHTSQAGAVDAAVESACMDDYFRFCAEHDPDGQGVRKCMRVNGPKLTKTCVNALVAAGEVSRKEVNRRSRRRRTARRR